MNIKIIITLLLSLLLTACSLTSSQPSWVDQPAESYSQKRYLSAVGEADSRNAANDRALANLAKIFEVAVKDQSLDFSEAQITTGESGRVATNKQSLARYVTTEAKHVLEGAQVVETWRSDEGRVFALAVLEKAPAERRFREGIRSADRKIEERVAYASQQAPNPVAALAVLKQARTIENQRSNLNRNLSVVSGKGIPVQYDQAKLEMLLRDALVTLHFSVVADSAQLQQNLESAVSALGITLDEGSSYQLKASMDTEELQKKQGWYWLRGSTELTLTHNDEVIAKKRWPLKVSATDKGQVEQRAKDMLSGKMADYVYELITSN